ncbi:MAG: hypothetical protein AAGF60_04415 [Pseudomonadota bacterium]
MRFPAATELLNTMADQLMAGDIRAVADRFVTPTPVYFDDDLMVVRTPEMARAQLSTFRGALLSRGVTRLRAEVTALSLPIGPLRRAWVTWRYQGPSGTPRGQARTHYVVRCNGQPDAVQLEMVQYTEIAFPTYVAGLPLAR